MATAELQQASFDPSVYEKLKVGMQVDVSTDPNGTNPGCGWICGVESHSVWIWFVAGDAQQGGRRGMLFDCWHRDDPRVKRQAHLISDAERRGVFWMSENQKQINSYAADMRRITEAMQEFVDREKALGDKIIALEGKIKELSIESGDAPRRRGRPPKNASD